MQLSISILQVTDVCAMVFHFDHAGAVRMVSVIRTLLDGSLERQASNRTLTRFSKRCIGLCS